MDLVAPVRGAEFLGAKDSTRMGSKDPGVWMFSGKDAPFGLYMLKNVPLRLAEQLVDFGTPSSRLKNGKAVWKLVKQYAAPRPFKSVR